MRRAGHSPILEIELEAALQQFATIAADLKRQARAVGASFSLWLKDGHQLARRASASQLLRGATARRPKLPASRIDKRLL